MGSYDNKMQQILYHCIEYIFSFPTIMQCISVPSNAVGHMNNAENNVCSLLSSHCNDTCTNIIMCDTGHVWICWRALGKLDLLLL